MPFDDLSKFLQAAADAGELERISLGLNPDQEIAALTQQISREFRDSGPVILFENPLGAKLPVVCNLLGHRHRFLAALGAESLDQVVERVRGAFQLQPVSRDWKSGFGGPGVDRNRFLPRTLRRGLCQQVVKLGKDIDLREMPVLRCWPGESGAAITSGQVITQSSDGEVSVELLPLEVIDAQTLQLHGAPDCLTFRRWEEHRRDQKQLPVAIALGGDPLLTYVSSLPLPGWLDPWYLAAILRNESLNLVRARSVELNVPADAELVLEGYVDAGEPIGRGTLAGPGGTLVARERLPRLQLTAITHRANPLLPALVRSAECSESLVCNAFTEKLLLGLLQAWNLPVVDLHLPAYGGHQRVIVVSTAARTAEDVDRLLHAVCGLPGAANARLVIAVSAEVDVRNSEDVWRESSLGTSAGELLDSETPVWSGQRLILNATQASPRLARVQRCEPAADVLAGLARKLGNPGWNPEQTAVSMPVDGEDPVHLRRMR